MIQYSHSLKYLGINYGTTAQLRYDPIRIRAEVLENNLV